MGGEGPGKKVSYKKKEINSRENKKKQKQKEKKNKKNEENKKQNCGSPENNLSFIGTSHMQNGRSLSWKIIYLVNSLTSLLLQKTKKIDNRNGPWKFKR